MNSENTHKCNTVTMTEFAHDLIIVLNKMSTTRPYDAINSYPTMYEDANALTFYTDAVRSIINSPKAPLLLLCKKELNLLLKTLEQDICFIHWHSEDNMFDIKVYGVEQYYTIQKQVKEIIDSLRFYMYLGKLCRCAKYILLYIIHLM